MKLRTFLIAGVLVSLSACVGLATGAEGQRPEPQALKDFKQEPDSPKARERYLQATTDVARSAYEKLKKARKGIPDSPRSERFDYEIRRASLEWFKAQVRVSTTPEEGARVAAEYLEREAHDGP
jgi:hypothetical protein